MPGEKNIILFVCGDVMLRRGIDQILPHPSDPTLYERYVGSALDYVHLAERLHGPINAPCSYDYVWGDALRDLDAAGVDARIINLETSITASMKPEGHQLQDEPSQCRLHQGGRHQLLRLSK